MREPTGAKPLPGRLGGCVSTAPIGDRLAPLELGVPRALPRNRRIGLIGAGRVCAGRWLLQSPAGQQQKPPR